MVETNSLAVVLGNDKLVHRVSDSGAAGGRSGVVTIIAGVCGC